jgi:hypothetical protein
MQGTAVLSAVLPGRAQPQVPKLCALVAFSYVLSSFAVIRCSWAPRPLSAIALRRQDYTPAALALVSSLLTGGGCLAGRCRGLEPTWALPKLSNRVDLRGHQR